MKTLVLFGAPESILIDRKPHLGTNRLIPLLRNFRQHLLDLGFVKDGLYSYSSLLSASHHVSLGSCFMGWSTLQA
nr:FAD/NAD(P)-binding oxidoreductase family protein [Tanacetum cinerariifolium]